MLHRRTLIASSIGALCSLGTGRAFLETSDLKLEVVRAGVRGLPLALDGFRIAVLSDFHLEPFTQISFLKLAIDAANALKPDLVVLLGDYVDATVESIHELAPALGKLNPRHGVVGVLGNHDHYKGAPVVTEVLRKQGIEMLVNGGFLLPGGRGGLFLAGTDSLKGEFELKKALSACPAGVPSILLSHEPDVADEVREDGRVALQLSGHSHGGQVRCAGVERLMLPPGGRKYPFGSYRLGSLHVHTSRGLGTTGLPVRLGSPPELTHVILEAKA